jgi:hypothetical protein
MLVSSGSIWFVFQAKEKIKINKNSRLIRVVFVVDRHWSISQSDLG